MSATISQANADLIWSVTLIQTKMTPPRLPSGYVSRRPLYERLPVHDGLSLVTVNAPAGFGKTTLLAEWCRELLEKKHVVAWLSLDDEDDDSQLFVAYLVASLCRADDEVGRQAQRLLRHDMLMPVGMIISVLLNEIGACERQVFLVLDDVDRLTSKPIVAILSRLLRYAPENLHIMFGARSDSTPVFGRVVAPERVARLDAEDLRFSVDDAQTFFSRTERVTLDRSSVKLLNDVTEGWVAGLQLASLALRKAGDATRVAVGLSGARIGTDTYLNDTVLTELPPDMLDFLLRTSILDRLGADVCDAVIGSRGASWEKLEWLERHNVFIRPLDDERQWFRYHALLGEALRRRVIRQMPDEIPIMHRRASQWFAEARLWPEAVKHALTAGDVEQAAQWVENCATAMVELGDSHTLLSWISRLPSESVDRRLRLRLAKALALAISMQNAAAKQEIHAVAAAMAQNEAKSKDDEALLAEVNSVSALIAIFNDDSDRALALGQATSACTVPTMPWAKRFAQLAQLYGFMYAGKFDEFQRTWALVTPHSGRSQALAFEDCYREYLYGLALLLQGEMSAGATFLEAAVIRAENKLGRNSGVLAGLAGCLSAIYYERNELSRAHDVVAGTTEIALDTCPLSGLLRHTCTAARLHARAGNTGLALAALENGRQVAEMRQLLRLRVGCDAETVRLFLIDERLSEAQQTVDELSLIVPEQCRGRRGTFLETWVAYQSVLSRVMIADGRANLAVVRLSAQRYDMAATSWRYQEAMTSVLLALALEQCGASREALTAVSRALTIAQTEGMVNIFVDEGPAMRNLIELWRRNSTNAPSRDKVFVDRLLSAFDTLNFAPVTPFPTPHTSTPGVLSSRELEILSRVARGLSNKEIGRELKVTPETVKWHLKNIFEKLNVSSRTEAVERYLQPIKSPEPTAGRGTT
ncbi:LuxR C-terminal-related transcriptional regulator [Burkholderia mayonis]|uniref:HTH luxR-type domain-containing protein n=1 Tax=Burkholderia mayonis TaxID=1385591 RepID=A0A1B4G5K0_9BURK|nr:LuxR C-terminal-related transcriptional regulator [Burkholderia mayonis]AOJ11169.1 hypothetical protein WS71_29135 [Burkholderia mayonis]KVE46143.1 hypothetical protein WS71_20305 [Burkholderia mayonis]